MTEISNKIDAHGRPIEEVLNNKKYKVDYFQREFKWEERHIEQLVSDLTSSFLSAYDPEDERKDVAHYNSYYLGPFVVSEKDGQRSIIDGQQRLTSLTLLLIYLNNLQKDSSQSKNLETLIFSEKYGDKSFNIQVEERKTCMDALFKTGDYKPKEDDDESTINMSCRYNDIDKAFPEEIKNDDVLPFFIDWLKNKVVLVEIIAYSDENAYTIFETMNDRGLNLTPTEMLKGFILSHFEDNKKRQDANELWKKSMQELHEYAKDEDLIFIQAWFRSQYAESIRPAKAGSKNKDFEKIGTRFHSWFSENLNKADINHKDSERFQNFIDNDFKFFLNAYKKVLEAERTLKDSLQHIFYIKRWGIANSLSYPLLLAPLKREDSPEVIEQKMNAVARYIETFAVRRSINFRNFGASSIRYTMYNLVKDIRRKSVAELNDILNKKIADMEESWDGIQEFGLHKRNGRFVKFLLSRITSFIEQEAGLNASFEKYYDPPPPGVKAFQVEHIWADKFDEHEDEFEQKEDFQEYRNRLGALVLLPSGTNQSFRDKPYDEKLKHYIRENLLVQSLCGSTYQNNPNFLKMKDRLQLPFKAHSDFKKSDIKERQSLYKAICESIWENNNQTNEI